MSSDRPPRIIIIAGPNGVGKATFAREFLPNEAACLQFVNADLIAAGLSPFAPEAAALQAGRLMLTQISNHVAHRRSFALETTLSGLAYARQIPQWRSVAQRFRQGGHHMPEAVIRRRFASCQANLARYCKLVDTWAVFDNQRETPMLIKKGDF